MAIMVFDDDGSEVDVTPTDITDLSEDEQIEFIRLWFRTHFEDPQNEMSYADKDEPYNYRYPWGGPYDAQDEIRNAFEGLAEERALVAVIEEMVQEAPFEWAPTSRHPERRALEQEAHGEMLDDNWPQEGGFQDGEKLNQSRASIEDIEHRLRNGAAPLFGSQHEQAVRQELLRVIGVLRSVLFAMDPVHGGIGHNKPPVSITLPEEIRANVLQSMIQAETELAKDKPDLSSVVRFTQALKAALVWFGEKANTAVDGFVSEAAKWGARATVAVGAEKATDGLISDIFLNAYGLAVSWLDVVTMPF